MNETEQEYLDIRAGLLQSGHSISSVARAIGKNPATVRLVLMRKGKSAPIEAAMLKLLGYNPLAGDDNGAREGAA